MMRRYSNDVTTLSFNDLVKNEENEKNKYNRLESNIYLNKRESYDDSNKLINSLNEELLSLKRKMKFVYEKDEEIQKLKNKVNELQSNDIKSQDKYKTENIALKLSLSSLEEKNKEYLNRINELISNENKEVELLNKLKKDNSLLKRELNLLKKQEDFDVEVKIKEKVKVDIQKLKRILSKKLENKREDKINRLLKEYNIVDKKEIDKDIIEKLIKETI
tara:strand:- start:2271 stop:2927 length:657 start_codon:yes stop_codon:yes gene_type:complete